MTTMNMVSAEEISQQLAISRRTIYDYARRKKYPLPGYKLGGRWVFRPDEVQDWVQAENRREQAKMRRSK